MMKLITLLCTFLWLMSANAHDERYYMLHPKKMEKALEMCSKNIDKSKSCEELQIIAENLNAKAYSLQMDPQAFGKKILELQQTIAHQENELRRNPRHVKLQTALNKNKSRLQEHLTLVRWLESPEG